jgi:hypothetical protein
MSHSLAAAAADFELPDDEGPIDFDQLVAEITADPLIARDALLRIAKAEREFEATKETRDAIADRYEQRLDQLARQIADNRRIVEAYVTRFGKVSFPDAGGAHLTTKAKGGSLRVFDPAALADWLGANGYETPTKEPQIDSKAALELARQVAHVHATPDGKIVDHVSGEVVEIPGLACDPETKTLAVRKP